MPTSRFSLPSLIALSCLIGFSSLAHGQSRVFASASSGNDANSCNNILTPCQTLQGAVNQVAAGGEVIVLTSGGYGPVTITKSLTIEAAPGVLAFIHPPSFLAVSINAASSDTVVLRGLTFNGGTSNGINVTTVGTLRVDRCIIKGFLRGIFFLNSGAQVTVTDTIVTDNECAGIYLNGGNAAIERSQLEGNGNGQSCVGLGGLNLVEGAKATVRNSVIKNNFRGIQAGNEFSSPVQLNIEDCVVAGNVVGVFATGDSSVVVRVSNTTITNNTLFGIEHQNTTAILSRGNNTVEGNAGGETFSGSYAAK